MIAAILGLAAAGAAAENLTKYQQHVEQCAAFQVRFMLDHFRYSVSEAEAKATAKRIVDLCHSASKQAVAATKAARIRRETSKLIWQDVYWGLNDPTPAGDVIDAQD